MCPVMDMDLPSAGHHRAASRLRSLALPLDRLVLGWVERCPACLGRRRGLVE
jgi:hypothetical protein